MVSSGNDCMARILQVTLIWHGVYRRPKSVMGKAGIYMVLAGKENAEGKPNPSTYKMLDLGQSGSTSQRLNYHDREQCWKKNTPRSNILFFKFAPMSSELYDEIDRRIVECCLRAHNRPLPCGSECNDGYRREDSVTIENQGKPLPLKPKYACRPERRRRPSQA